jgi:Protein of unknown function (DUF3050)
MDEYGLPQFVLRARQRREELIAHPMYHELQSLDDLRRFMESHVFAVWDFMSLLKRLQQLLTTVTLPWVPSPARRLSRFINQLVLDEESDADGLGNYASHFEIYRRAMQEMGADTLHIDAVVRSIEHTGSWRPELIPEPARSFVRSTFALLEHGLAHEVAAAFAFGREDAVPDMFRALIGALDWQNPGLLAHVRYYLERHIGMDEQEHTPMALAMVNELCGTDELKWREATRAVDQAVAARLALWDGIQVRVGRSRSSTRLIAQRAPGQAALGRPAGANR